MALFLDWAKAFDRVRTDSMICALHRFGVPEPILSLISGIYKDRTFVLLDPGGKSSLRCQSAGIAQGCPLSPYLFIMVQTVLLSAVDKRLQETNQARNLPQDPEYIVCNDLLYADDTVLFSACTSKL